VSGSAADKVVVLDRDGTIVVDRDYLSDPAGLEFLPGAAQGLRAMYDDGYRLLVVTNQSGVGRGMFSLDALQKMNERLSEMVSEAGARLERIYFCPHRPDERCACRKPATQLLSDAASELGFEPSHAVVIGDKASDIEFGYNAGATTMLIAASQFTAQTQAGGVRPDYVVRDLSEAAELLRKRA
jgi:D-glycero-D-manno-heptose 1,7-bisphosphate phosphatase